MGCTGRMTTAGPGETASAGLSDRHVRWMAYHPEQSDFELAGTEPAGIFISRDGGESWRECPEVAEMRHRFRWYLPYSPEAGCVRGFAHHGDRAYAAVEVGGVLVSQDGGETWTLAQGSPGVHTARRRHSSTRMSTRLPSIPPRQIGSTHRLAADSTAPWTAELRGRCCTGATAGRSGSIRQPESYRPWSG